MTDQTTLTLRAKILGVLLRDARLAAGKSPKECAAVLGMSSRSYTSLETGARSISLPELEVLAYFLDTSLSHFWGDEAITASPERGSDINPEELTILRHRIVGAQLRQARLNKSISQKELAAAVGIRPSRLKQYEYGQKPVPIPELEALCMILGLKIQNLIEKQGPVGEWDATRRAFERFKALPPELQDFVTNPANEHYLRVAMQLSDLSAERLRAIAEGLLDITY